MKGSTYLLCLALAACGGPADRPSTDANPGGGDGNGNNNNNSDNCPDTAKSVYVVDQNNAFLRFDPPTKSFTPLGTLSCPAGGATPFSMAVDRTTVAWVLYSNGRIFRVDIANNLACTATNWVTQNGLSQFGMGFSTDAAGGTSDTLFIAGGSGPTQPTSQLAKLSLSNFQSQPVGSVQGWPELAGTGNAELWGFFPATSGSRIVKLDKANGAALQTFNLGLAGEPTAWAFAFWGGDFYVFLMKNFETSTTIYQYGPNGELKDSKAAPGRTIVGAGVSTCAPVIL